MAWPQWAKWTANNAVVGIIIGGAIAGWTSWFNARKAFEQNLALEIVKRSDPHADIKDTLRFLCETALVDDDRGPRYWLWIFRRADIPVNTPSICGKVKAPIPDLSKGAPAGATLPIPDGNN
jgi:hypothetical protein